MEFICLQTSQKALWAWWIGDRVHRDMLVSSAPLVFVSLRAARCGERITKLSAFCKSAQDRCAHGQRGNMEELTIASAQPFPFKMPPTGRVALIMIDWQRDFLEEGGFGHALGNDVSTLRRGLGPAAAVLTAARACGVPIIHTLETHKPDLSDLPAAKLRRCPAIGKALEAEPARGRLLVAGEPGNAIVDEVAPIAGELVLHKPGKGAFCGTALHDELRARGVTHLLVTGVTTEVCVQSTLAGSKWQIHAGASAAPATQKPDEMPRGSATSALESRTDTPLRTNRYAARGQRPRVRLPGGE